MVNTNLSFLNKEISFFIPFRNEEENLANTVNVILQVARVHLNNFEIILVNDGSIDRSLQIALNLSQSSEVRTIDLGKNFGFGTAYLKGFEACRLKFAMYLTADGDVHCDELAAILQNWCGSTPLIQSAENSFDRSMFRFLLSKLYTYLVRLLSRTWWPYYNGFNILPTQNKKNLKWIDLGFCTQTWLNLQLIKGRQKIQFIQTRSRFKDETSQAMTVKNFKSAFKFFLYLLVLR